MRVLIICTSNRISLDDEMKKNETRGTCGSFGGKGEVKLKEREHLKDRRVA